MTTEIVEKAESILAHYGVKGQKWGVRKASKPAGIGGRNYDTKNKSNEELKKIIARMKLEQEYKELNKKATSEGKKIIHDILKNAPKAAAGAVITGLVTKKVVSRL